VINYPTLNERQRARVDYFFKRTDYWRDSRRDETTARMQATRDADHIRPLRTEQEGIEVFEYLRRLGREQSAEENRPR
jgi:hypothetical protein